MLNNKSSLFLLCLGMSLSHLAPASEYENDVISGCKQLDHLAKLGQQQYQNKNYLQALDYFKEQASWMHFCSFHEDITKRKITTSQLATAYNNVGLTYSQLHQPRWAKAWYALFPNDPKSKYNLKNLTSITPTNLKTGTYVKYIGQGAWDTIRVTQNQKAYQIDYLGLRMGANGMLYGPNVGEFSTQMQKSDSKTQYQDNSCVIQLEFYQGERIHAKQNQADCGFGLGVTAEGTYFKVEDVKDYARYAQ